MPKGHLVQYLRDNKMTRIVVTGPDFIGCTTLLRLLEKDGYHVEVTLDKPAPEQRP